MNKKYIPIAEAAEKMGVVVGTLYSRVHNKTIPFRKKGRKLFVVPLETHATTRAERVVKRADKSEARTSSKPPKHLLRIYTHEDGHSVRSPFTIHSWGELLDVLISCERNGTLVEELHMECNV